MPNGSQKKPSSPLIIPGKASGVMSLADMEEIIHIAKKYQVPRIKITSAKRLAFSGAKEKDRESIKDHIDRYFHVGARGTTGYVIACQERNSCKHACFSLDALTADIESLFNNLLSPAKLKIGISSCPRNCCASFTKDIGLFANLSGWTLVFGGNAGAKPRIADIIIEGLSDSEVFSVVEKCLNYYLKNAKKGERTARFVERAGIESLKKAILS
ncbi:MAG: NAD(P)/FAD-dependent oxidoreductase [Thermodesulfobacteriota bacterium]